MTTCIRYSQSRKTSFSLAKPVSGKVTALIASMAFFLTALPAHADFLFGDFTFLNGSVSAVSGGHVTFALNSNGTIAASLTSFVGPIYGFGFDSVGDLPQSNFSPGLPDDTAGWTNGDLYQSGFLCVFSCGVSETWTIGNPGDFSSVTQALGGGTATYDFLLIPRPGCCDLWTGNAVVTEAPEPAALFLLATGLGIMRLSGWRRKRQALRRCRSRAQSTHPVSTY